MIVLGYDNKLLRLVQGLESLTTHTKETTTLGFDDLEARCEDL